MSAVLIYYLYTLVLIKACAFYRVVDVCSPWLVPFVRALCDSCMPPKCCWYDVPTCDHNEMIRVRTLGYATKGSGS